MNDALTKLSGGLVVSCQAYPGEPMRDPVVMRALAQACVIGGAAGIRAQGLQDLEAIRGAIDVPLIGLVKVEGGDVYITPTVALCVEVAAAGADIVAFDGTTRARPDGSTLADLVRAVHAAGALAMADCGSVEDARASIDSGADCVGTTLSGYTGARPRTKGPDFELLSQLVALRAVPVMAEGRIHTPADVARAFELGADMVTVGTAITHPTSIARRFVDASPLGKTLKPLPSVPPAGD